MIQDDRIKDPVSSQAIRKEYIQWLDAAIQPSSGELYASGTKTNYVSSLDVDPKSLKGLENINLDIFSYQTPETFKEFEEKIKYATNYQEVHSRYHNRDSAARKTYLRFLHERNSQPAPIVTQNVKNTNSTSNQAIKEEYTKWLETAKGTRGKYKESTQRWYLQYLISDTQSLQGLDNLDLDVFSYQTPEAFKEFEEKIVYATNYQEVNGRESMRYSASRGAYRRFLQERTPQSWLLRCINNELWEDFKQNNYIAIELDSWDRMGKKSTVSSPSTDFGNFSEYGTRDEIKDKMREIFDTPREPTNRSLCIWQFVHEMRIDDIVYIKDSKSAIIARGKIKSDFIYDENKDIKNRRNIEWLQIETVIEDDTAFTNKVLTNITSLQETKNLEDLFLHKINTNEEYIDSIVEKYTEVEFLKEVYMEKEKYSTIVNLLRRKKNIILQGSPGVGKTFAAKRLAYSFIGEKDRNKVQMIQFHQNYSYEDFIMGYRPTEKHFELKNGPFYNFCEKAREDKDNDYIFIIDEINRGQMSKIFGELLMLIEADKRGESLPLVYNSEDEEFSVPENLYLIGMMNTADRSLAVIDYALRRRFSFIDFPPAFEVNSFKEEAKGKGSQEYLSLIEKIKELNKDIAEDNSLGEGFQIGHSYFCIDKNIKISREILKSILDYDIIPLLKEYWFDEPEKIAEWSEKLKGSINVSA